MGFKLERLVLKEREEHSVLMKWVRLNPQVREYFIHIVNEGKRDRVSGAILKNMGLKKGVSDFFFARPRGRYAGLWIELKRKEKFRIAKEQEEWINLMKSVGYYACFCYGANEAILTIKDYLACRL